MNNDIYLYINSLSFLVVLI